MKYKFSRRFLYVCLRFIGALLIVLPWDVAVFLGGRLGVLAYYLLRGARKQTQENLKIAFSSEKTQGEISKIAKEVFRNLGYSAAEFINFAKINKTNIDNLVSALGIEKIDKAFADGKGAIALASHFGNWELLAVYFGIKGYPANAITRPLRYEKFDSFVNSRRRSKNINIITRAQSFKKIVSILKDNQLVGLLPDQDIDSVDGVFVDFFGRPAYTPAGPVLLAMASGSPVFPAFCIRRKNFPSRYTLVIGDRIEFTITADKEKDIVVNTQKWSDLIEGYIRRYPSQWVWVHKRWKTQPRTL